MADEDGESLKKKTYEQCSTLQSMIEISIEHLDGLRTCEIDRELIHQEIRNIEVKLIRLFSKQILNKQLLNKKVASEELPHEIQTYPLLKQWLHVVGLSAASVKDACNLIPSLESLLEKSDNDIKLILGDTGAQQDEIKCLISAVQSLKKCIEYQVKGEKNCFSNLDLHWDSWDRGATSSRHAISTSGLATPSPSSSPHSATRSHQGSTTISLSDDVFTNPVSSQHPPWSPAQPIQVSIGPVSSASTSPSSLPTFTQDRERAFTPPSTPPTSHKREREKLKFPTTPPPRRNQTIIKLEPDAFPLTKSKSHESQLGNRIDKTDNALLSPVKYQPPNLWIGRSYEQLPRRPRLPTEPSPEVGLQIDGIPDRSSPQINSPLRSPLYPSSESEDYPKSLLTPKSPRTPTIPNSFHMGHTISHRFTNTLKVTNCDICEKQMIIGYRCKECKFVCHRDCAIKAPPLCGLPNEYLDLYGKTLMNVGNHSPQPVHQPVPSPINTKESKPPKPRKRQQQNISIQPFLGQDSSSNTSSCNSSTPSSPAVATITHTPPLTNLQHQFQFPDVANSGKDITIETRPLTEQNEMVETQKSNDSDKTVSGTSESTDSEKTLAGRVDSQDSQISDVDPLDRSLPRQNSLSLREWDIPYNELDIEDELGTGRFGKVHRGNWHGDVAIKFLNMDHMDDEKTLDAFKQEVATFRKTRHENLVLFMGACMKPPHLAIITSLCKGMTLYTHIHLRRERFNMNKIVMVAQQITQGMGYLHARGIVHKDLKTKNIFLESGKVVITDFGLFSVTKLCYGNRKGNWLTIPPGWLCYLAPEIICCLRAAHDCHENDNLPFTVHSDVYAFGTVWYELLCGEWPFKGQPPESIIWQVGRGIKQSLASIQATRDVKDILMTCWSFKPNERPDFSQLFNMFEKLPKKRLARSPSHPIHLSRSAESVF